MKKFSFSAMPRTALNYCKAEWSSWQERVEEECWVKLSNVQDSAESSWVQIRTAMSKEECWVKLSNVRDSTVSSWVQIGTAPSKEELSPGRMYSYARSTFNILYTLKILRMQCDSTLHYILNIIICHYIGKLGLIMSCGKKMQYHLYENSLWKSVSAGQKEKSRWVVTLKVLWDKVF